MKPTKEIKDSAAIMLFDVSMNQNKEYSDFLTKIDILFNHPCISKIGLPVTFIDLRSAAKEYLTQFICREIEPCCSDSIFLYPGESSRFLQELGVSEGFRSENIFAKRIWHPGNDPIVVMNSLAISEVVFTKVKKVIVIDDVIGSGKTMSLLYERNYFRFPLATWHAVAVISRKSILKKFEQIYAPFYAQDLVGKKIPINSVSTLITDKEIGYSYFSRNFMFPDRTYEAFLKIIRSFV
jgi:hypothetical protein